MSKKSIPDKPISGMKPPQAPKVPVEKGIKPPDKPAVPPKKK